VSASYFEQPDLWQNQPDPYQVQTQADILDLLPEAVERVLDVGCGDGFITNQLPPHLFVAGLDASYQALQGVRYPASLGEITALPFPDDSFDLVMANDVLEHLPAANLEQALVELRRVARAYLLVTVPFEEDLKAHEAKCGHCGTIYHVNHHQRAFSKNDMLSLFKGLAEPLEIRFSGYLNRPPLDPTTQIRQRLNVFDHWHNAQCPVCGSGEQVHSTVGNFIENWLDRKRAELWAQRFQSDGLWSNRTEIMALYTCTGSPAKRQRLALEINEQSLLRVDFRNPLQIATPDFTAGYLGAQFRLASHVTLTADGVTASSDPGGIPMVAARFPVNPQIQDSLEIEVLSGEGGNVRLYALGYSREHYLTSFHFDPEINRAIYTFDRAWRTEPLGFVLQVYPDSSISVQSIRYIPMNGEKDVSVPFVKLHPGHNVVPLEPDGGLLTWGFFAPHEGSIPLVSEDRYSPLNDTRQVSIEEALMEAIRELYQQEQLSLQALDTAVQLEQVSTSLKDALSQLKQSSIDLSNTQQSLSSAGRMLRNADQGSAEQPVDPSDGLLPL
jgi:SAM-dependent methyltransferase